MKNLLLIFLLLSSSWGFSQDKMIASNLVSYKDSINGTYQIQVINTRSQPMIPENLNEIILKNRNIAKYKYIQLASDVRLMIAPLDIISSPNFKPLDKLARITE